jgi:predicted nucleotidyltransferase
MAVSNLLAPHSDKIEQICECHGVARLELFGSAANESFDPKKSDLDFLVEFRALDAGQRANAYFGLLEDLEALLNRHVDLVMTRAIRNPYFLKSIARTRTVLYAA